MGDFTTYALALIPLAAIIIYSNLCNTLKSYVDKLCIFSLAFLCLYISYHLIFNDFHRYNENALNFQIIIHPIVQTFFGKGIWINQMSQYGGYPYFFEPILKVIGLSIVNITSIYALLMLASLSLFAYSLYKIIDNKVLLVCGFIGYLFIHFFSASLWPYELYLQYYPTRTLFPAICLFLGYHYLKKPSVKFYLISISILTLGLIWCIDTGIFALFAFLAATLYHILSSEDKNITKIKNIAYHFIYAVLAIILTLSLFALYTKLRFGSFLDFSKIVQVPYYYLGGGSKGVMTSWVYAKEGENIFYWQHAWVLSFFTYITTLAYSTLKIVKQEKSLKNSMIFLIATLGIGLFTYNINNLNEQLVALCGYPFIFLLIIFADSTIKGTKVLLKRGGGRFCLDKSKTVGERAIGIFLVLLFSFLVPAFFLNINRNHIMTNQARIHEFYPTMKSTDKDLWTKRGTTGPKSTSYVKMKDVFREDIYLKNIPDNAKAVWLKRAADLEAFFKNENIDLKGKKIFILSMWDGYLHLRLKTPSVLSNAQSLHSFWAYDPERVKREVYDRIINKELDIVVFDTQKHIAIDMRIVSPKMRTLLKENGYTFKVIQTADTWYDGWEENHFLIYTKKQNGNCSIVSENEPWLTPHGWSSIPSGVPTWHCK